MLVLTRQVGTAIVIGHEIVVKVIRIKGDKVHLGIEAPKEVTIHREQVAVRIKLEGNIAK